MGTTIRREPVTSKIPASEDYKYLNITEFRGIDKSSNPFTQSYNTASEALNVYVDETNALTTRPRLQKFVEITQLDEIISVHNISNGFLIQGKKNNNIKLYIKTSTGITEVTKPTGVTVNAKITAVFEQDNKIYFINGSNYYVITVNNSAYTVNYVEGYIPTTIVGKTLTSSGTSNESLNALTNKYKESYFWDGTWNPESEMTDDTDVVDNKYVIGKTYSLTTSTVSEVFRTLEKNTNLILIRNVNDNDKLYLRDLTGGASTTLNTITGVTLPTYETILGDCSDDGRSYVYYLSTNGDFDDSVICGGVFVFNNNKWYTLINNLGKNCTLVNWNDDNEYVVRCNDDCSIVACVYENNNLTKTVDVFRYNINTDNYDKIMTQTFSTTKCYINLSRNGDTITIKYDSSDKFYTNEVTSLLSTTSTITTSSVLSEDHNRNVLSYDGKYIYLFHLGSNDQLLITLDSGNITTTPLTIYNRNACFSKENDKLCIFTNDNNDGWFMLEDLSFVSVKNLSNNVSTIYNCYFENSKIILILQQNNPLVYRTVDFDYTSLEPLLYITHTLTSDDTQYDEWNKLKPNNSKLTTRFNNERWFAKGNKTFYTQNNDPTYIPISSYNINGDLDEITAMNVISDSILGLYKKDDLWLVNLTTDSNGDVVYYYNENNNVVGNDAFNAAITTIYSNLPIQITYDGVYTIQQQSNVAAPDRLAKSLSDGISDMWLKENKKSIANAQTINRLYWTYIILPIYDESTNEQLNNTKVYLLDNRTLSWYYWELPTTIVSSFVKDNKVYLADKNGFISTLETSDITKILSENASISEYYDFDEQIINWYWQSQILPLGTINYSKKLVNTTFIVTDTDENDGYSIQYQFNVFRRAMGETNVKNITNKLNYVQSVTKKTFISRFNFIQIKLFNMDEDLDNNKLRLVGLGLKYVLLEGML